MLIQYCKSKIAHATITEAELFYEGSITIDEDLLNAAEIIPGQKVEVLNMNNGERFETYAIVGKSGSGQVCLNGPAARLGLVGDKIIILNYVLLEPEQARKEKTRLIKLDDNNRIKK